MNKGKMAHGPQGIEKPKDFKGTMKKLLGYLKEYKVGLILVLFFAILGTVFSVIGPKILGTATTEIFNGLVNKITGIGGIDFGKIGKILLFLLGLYIVSALFSFIEGIIMTNVSQKMAYKLRRQIVEKVGRMPMKAFDGKTHGEVLSIITNDVDTLSSNMNQSLTQVITSVTMMIGVLIMMFTISGAMTLLALIIIPISLFFVVKIVGKSQKHFIRQQEYLGHINGQVEETYSGHTIVKTFNGEEEAIKKFKETNDVLYNSAWKSQFMSGMMMPIMNFIGNLGYVMVSIVGGWFVIKGRIEVGDILSFTQYIRNFTQPLSQVAQVVNLLQSTVAASERVFAFLDSEEESETGNAVMTKQDADGNIVFDHVTFGYNPEQIIINDFSATVKAGQKIAIVGPTGAGKTTMVKLLMRFYDVNKGSIMLNGKDVRDFKRSELRSAFGMVLQDTWLFNGTIKENISYGKLSATDEEIEAAAKAAHVDHFIHTLPNAYNMELNEEASNISGGQKQLLTIARVILKDPEILILDEATSSVDTRTEQLIQKAMDNLMEGRTSFIIAHRLSTIKNADLILVMDHGDIVEQGNHEELLKKNGFYAKLYNSQFEEAED